MSINKENTNMLIINKNKDINSKLKFYVHKFFSLRNYDFVYFYGPYLNIFGENPHFNTINIDNLEPSSWMTDNINSLKKNKILIVNRKLSENDMSIIKCFLETEYINIDLIVICSKDENIDFLSSDFYSWESIKTIKEKQSNLDSDYDMFLHHLYDN